MGKCWMKRGVVFDWGIMEITIFKFPLMELLAIRLGCQKTTAKSLVMPPFYKVGYRSVCIVPHFEKGGLGGICRGINNGTMP